MSPNPSVTTEPVCTHVVRNCSLFAVLIVALAVLTVIAIKVIEPSGWSLSWLLLALALASAALAGTYYGSCDCDTPLWADVDEYR